MKETGAYRLATSNPGGRAEVSTWPACGWTEPRTVKRRPPADAAFIGPGDFTRTLRRSLRQLQYRPALIDGCLAETGLTITGRLPAPHWKPQQEARTSQRMRRGSR